MPANVKYLKETLGAAAIVTFVAVVWWMGSGPEPGMIDEPAAVRVLRDVSQQAKAYRSAHPEQGYPQSIRDLLARTDPLRCGLVTESREVCSPPSRKLPAEYVFSYKSWKSQNSQTSDRFAINADSLS